jgi:hypothetical protein
MYGSEGIGVWKCTVPGSGNTITWTAQTAGIENMVTMTCLATTYKKDRLLVTVWDRGVLCGDQGTYPSTAGTKQPPDQAILKGGSITFSPQSPANAAVIDNWFGHEESGYSTDGGLTWTEFANYPSNNGTSAGGLIRMPTDGNHIIWWLNYQQGVWYTTTNDASSGWIEAQVPGVICGSLGLGGTAVPRGWTPNTDSSIRNYACVDASGVLYAFNYGNDSPALQAPASPSIACTGVSGQFTLTGIASTTGLTVGVTVSGTGVAANATIASVDSSSQVTLNLANTGTVSSVTFVSQSGIYITSAALGLFTTWQRVFTGIPPGISGGGVTAVGAITFNCPRNQSNVLFMATGHTSGPNVGVCLRSIDGGVTWTTVPLVKGIQGSLGFGPPGAGHTTQSMMFLGWYNATYGVWISDNACDPAVAVGSITWQQVGLGVVAHPQNPLDSWDIVNYFDADPFTHSKCYVGFNGSSFAYYQP